MGLSSNQVSGDQGLDWPQTFRHSTRAEISKPPSTRRQPPHQQSEALKCPRCSSTNTKFCYYNNYNKSQPRHFCKSCKRHWTKGGTLRNVPVGGGRKNKRPKISKPAAPSAAAAPASQDFSSTILYNALMGRSSSPLMYETSKGSDSLGISGQALAGDPAGLNQTIPNTEFQFSSLSTFEMNGSFNPASYHSSFDNFTGNLDSVEESTITTVNIPAAGGDCGGAWTGVESRCSVELPNYWNWNDMDVLTSGDLSVSWDDQIKTIQ